MNINIIGAGSDLGPALWLTLVDPAKTINNVAELVKKPEVQELTEELRISFQFVMAGRSVRDIKLQDKILDQILEETGAWKVKRFCEEDMAEFTNVYLQRLGLKHLKFVWVGGYLGSWMQPGTPDFVANYVPTAIKGLYRDATGGKLVQCGGDALMGCGSTVAGGGWSGLEQFVSYDPADRESIKAGTKPMETPSGTPSPSASRRAKRPSIFPWATRMSGSGTPCRNRSSRSSSISSARSKRPSIPTTSATGTIRPCRQAKSICGTDLEYLDGTLEYRKGGALRQGAILGHEFSAEVVEIGEGVTGWSVGDRVTMNNARASSSCGAMMCSKAAGVSPMIMIDIHQKRLDKALQMGADLILGSASPDVVKKASETLAGRLAFAEMTGFALWETGVESERKLWLRGGFSRLFLARSDENSMAWLEGFIRTFLERDIPTWVFPSPPSPCGVSGQCWHITTVGSGMRRN